MIQLTHNHICILRLSAIGDCCHVVAVVQAIQRRHPNIKITWIIGKIEHSLFAGLPGVEFITYDKKSGAEGKRKLLEQLNGQTFDALLHMQLALRASLLARSIPAKIKVGFDFKRAKELQWLFTNKKIEAKTRQHVLDGLMGFAAALDVDRADIQWNFPIDDADKVFAKENIGHEQFMVINPAASRDFRNWQPASYAAVVDFARQEFDLPCVLTGGPSDEEVKLANSIEALATAPIINLVGKTTLKQLAAVISNAQVMVAPDTGPLHMATMVNTPAIGLYANSNPERTGPYRWQQFVVNKYPESVEATTVHKPDKLKWGYRLKDAENMKRIGVEDVNAMLAKVLTDQIYQT